MLADLISQIETHLAWRDSHGQRLAPTTFGLRAVNDGKLVERLKGGGQITVDKMQRVLAFIERDRSEIEASQAQGADAPPTQDQAA